MGGATGEGEPCSMLIAGLIIDTITVKQINSENSDVFPDSPIPASPV